MFSCILVIKEAKFSGSFYRRGGIYLGGKLLCSIIMDEANSSTLWVKFKENPLLCDNESAIKIANNPIQHSRTKHIDI
jgi:hypothetical protein